ncbi:MAG: VPLPA-CTERM sorting domain-containing protein [Desulfuromonadaceae bacterium]
MNLSQKTSLSLLFVSLSAVSANAALSGDNETAEISIEKTAQNRSLQPLDQLLGGGNHADLFGTVLKQHEESAQPAKSTMEGHFERDGSEQPVVHSGGLQALLSAPSLDSASAPNLSLTATVHLGAQAETPAATAAGSSSSATGAGSSAPKALIAPNTLPYTTTVTPSNQLNYTTTITPSNMLTYTTTITTANPVPLPAAGLLLASGLIGITGLSKRQRQE